MERDFQEIDNLLNTINESCNELRKYINIPKHQDMLMKNSEKWNILCSSLGTIEDATSAIRGYIILPESETDEIKYLALYGLLQSAVLQQDTLKHLYKILCCREYALTPDLKYIRDIRIKVAGHPAYVRNTKDSNILPRILISKKFFTIVTYSGKKVISKEIQVIEILNKQ